MNPWLGWTMAALVSWGIWAVLSKLLGTALAAEQSQALSTLGMLPILLPMAWRYRRSWRGVRLRGIGYAVLGGVASCLGNVAYYDALARDAKAAAVVSLTALYPLTTIVLAVALLGERLNPVQMAGVAVSLVAIWFFNVSGGGAWLSPTVVFALPPILLWGISGFLQKVSTRHLAAEPAAVGYLGAFVPVAVWLAWSHPWPRDLTGTHWALVLALGFFLAFGNVAVLAAFARDGKAAIITPLSSLYPIISVPIAVLFFGESIGGREGLGIACALTSVVALSFESRPRRPEPPKPDPR